MKNFLYLSLLLIGLSSCKKEKHTPNNNIFGTWELRREVGGIAGINKTYPAGNGNKFIFNADSTFKAYHQSTVADQGTFKIVKNGVDYGNIKFDGIFFNHNQSGQPVERKTDTLTIGMDFDDGIAATYVRQ
ncbi:hypothetical protein BH09BAC6_BH09BAC6_32240 [soil metagenome]|jgi:hypothetical protein